MAEDEGAEAPKSIDHVGTPASDAQRDKSKTS
jgi:hypothetical protein